MLGFQPLDSEDFFLFLPLLGWVLFLLGDVLPWAGLSLSVQKILADWSRQRIRRGGPTVRSECRQPHPSTRVRTSWPTCRYWPFQELNEVLGIRGSTPVTANPEEGFIQRIPITRDSAHYSVSLSQGVVTLLKVFNFICCHQNSHKYFPSYKEQRGLNCSYLCSYVCINFVVFPPDNFH